MTLHSLDSSWKILHFDIFKVKIGAKLRKWQGKTCTIEKLGRIFSHNSYTHTIHASFKLHNSTTTIAIDLLYFLPESWILHLSFDQLSMSENALLPSHSFVSNNGFKKWQNPRKSKVHQFGFSAHAFQEKVNPKHDWLIWKEMAFLITLDQKITVQWKTHLSISLNWTRKCMKFWFRLQVASK